MASIINCAERERVDLVEMCVPCSTRLAAAFGRNNNYDSLTVAELREQNPCNIVRDINAMAAEEAEKKTVIDNRVQRNTMNEPREGDVVPLVPTEESARAAVEDAAVAKGMTVEELSGVSEGDNA